jgi:hypothetical protein
MHCSNIDLAIDKGEFVSLIGPSGCGKTTLLRVIADLEKPTERHDHRQRHDPGGGAAQARLWLRVPGGGAVSLAHHRRQCRAAAWRSWVSARRSAKAHVGKPRGWSIWPVSRRSFPWQLSGGMQQRASIARALALQPDMLLDGRAVRRAGRDRARSPQRAASEAVGRDEKDHRVRHPLDPRGGVPVDQDRGDEPAPGPYLTTLSIATSARTVRSISARHRSS